MKLKIFIKKFISSEYFLLITITCLGGFLRFYHLGDWSLWNDEVHTIYVALTGILKDKVGQSIFYPINFLIAKLSLQILGINEFGARFFPCIFGIATIPLVYYVTKYLFNKNTALLASLFLSLHTWHIDWSQNARYYSLECFLVVISFYLFFKGFEENKQKLIIFSLLTIFLAVLCHPSASFMVVAYLFYLLTILLFNIQKPFNFNKNCLLFISPFLLISIILLPWYKNLILFLLKERGVVSSPFYILQNVSYHVTLPFLIIAITTVLYLILNREKKGIFLICCTIIPFLLLLLASKITLAYGAYVFYTLPFYCILVAYGCDQLFQHLQRDTKIFAYGIPLSFILILISNDYLYFVYENGNRPKWKEASLYVEKHMKPTDIVFASEGGTVQFYLKNISNNVYWLSKFKSAFKEINDRRIWFLIYNENQNILHQKNFLDFLHNKCKLMTEFLTNTSVKRRNIKIYLYIPS